MITNDIKNIPEFSEKFDLSLNRENNHVLIESENLHALTLLRDTLHNKVNFIYIDPPYNTGKQFIYNDKRYGEKTIDKHHHWLSFMDERLTLAKELLAEDGIIFISIDDKEQAYLKILCDGIFGEDSFHGMITWQKRHRPINIGRARHQLQAKLEYILVYSKVKADKYPAFNTEGGEDKIYPHQGKLGACRFKSLVTTSTGISHRPNLVYPILGIMPPEHHQWRFGRELAESYLDNDRIEVVNGLPKLAIYPEDEESKIIRTFWSHLSDEFGTSQEGKQLLNKIIGEGHGFDTVKPVNLIKEIIQRHPNKNAIVLDFFAGSGTTMHAVAELNHGDTGNRQCILITDNEGGIARNITAPRLQRVLSGENWSDGKAHTNLNSGFIYLTSEENSTLIP
jgi:adenine-specific DNA-methyltransferase